MNIEIHQPEVTVTIVNHVRSASPVENEEALLEELHAKITSAADPNLPPMSVDEIFGMVRGLAEDLDISRSKFRGRPLDLS